MNFAEAAYTHDLGWRCVVPSGFRCVVCKCDLGWDRPSGVCSEKCLREGQGFEPKREERAEK